MDPVAVSGSFVFGPAPEDWATASPLSRRRKSRRLFRYSLYRLTQYFWLKDNVSVGHITQRGVVHQPLDYVVRNPESCRH